MGDVLHTVRFITVLSVCTVLIACSSSSSTDSSPTTGSNLIPENTLNKRIKTKAIDINQDGSIDVMTTYNYDARNRISTRLVERIDGSSYTVTYRYEGDLLISKTSTDNQEDTHTYENGLLTASSRQWDGDYTFQYNAQGQLIGTTGDAFLYSDECDFETTAGSAYIPSFTINYAGNRPSTIATEDGHYLLMFNYTGSRTASFESTYDCGSTDPDSIVSSSLQYSYDDNGRIIRIQIFDGAFSSNSQITYGSNGRPSGIVQTNSLNTTTAAFSYSDEGLLIQQEISSDAQGATIIQPDITVNLEYEEGSCVVSLSSNPASLVLFEVTPNPLGIDAHLNCGYSVDETSF